MRIAFNPSTVAALTTPPNNKDITFDLKGRNIFARGVKFYGTDTNTWRPVVDNLTSNSTTSSLSANQGRVLKALIDGKSDSGHNHDGRYVRYYAVTTLDCNNLAVGLTAARVSATNAAHTNHSVYLYILDIGTPFQIQIPDSNVPYIYKRYYSSGKWSGWFKLNAGYADSAGSVAWANITGKPSSYTPSAHTHAWNSLTHSSTTENQAILTNGKANGWKLYTLNISGWNNAANNAHSHANKSVLDGITSGLVSNWNTAYTFVHTITGTDTDKVINKWDEIVNFLAGITEDNKLNTLLNSKLSVYELADKTNVGTIKNNGIYYSTSDASSGTLINSPFSNGFALINMTSYDGGDDLRRSRLAFNAFGEIKVSDDRGQSNTAETWYNVLTSKNSGISGSTIKLNGTSITVYSSGTADGRYVKKSGDTMTGILTIDTTNFGTLIIKRNDDANGASIQFRGKSSVYGYIGLNNSTKDKQFLRWNSDTSKVYTILDTSSTYTSSGKGVINGTIITQVDNATNATNSTNARKLVNWYSARPTSLNAQFGDGSLRIFYATSSTTEGKSPEDATVLHLAWDNNGGWDSQLAIGHSLDRVYLRSQNNGTWQPWKTLAFTTDIPSSLKNPHSFNVFGVTYDGSAAKTVTTSTFISQVNEGTSTITDGTMLITSYASNSGFADTNAVNVPYKRKAVHLWEYIKAKTDSLYATKNHNHDGRYVYNYGGTAANGQTLNQNALFMSTTSGITGDWWHILQAAWNGEYRWNSQIAFPTQNRNGMYYRSGLDDNTKWGAWVKLLDVNNYSSTLDSRYYTESEVNSLLSNKLNTSNFNWTNLPGKIVVGNEFNIVNAGFKEHMWFNYLPINDRSKTATISGYHFGNGNRGYTSIRASGFIKSGGNASQLLRADGGVAAFNWSGQAGQPTWLWGGNSQHSYYVYNPSNFRVAYAVSAGNADTLDGERANSFVRAGAIDTDKADLNALDTYSFIKSVNSEVADHSPKRNTGWYNVIQLVHRNGSGDGPGYIGQIALGMTTNTDDMFFRGKRTDSWKTVIHSGNISSQTVASATKLQTARKIWGQSFDGTADVDNTLRIKKTTGSYCEGIRIQTEDGKWATIILGATADSGTNANAWSIHRKNDNNFAISRNSSDGANGLVMTSTGMGLGTTAPTQRLDVAGNIRATGQLYLPTNGNYNAILMGDDCWMGDCNISNVIGLSGRNNSNAGGIKFGKGGMYIGYNGSTHYSSGTSLWSKFNADLLDGYHADKYIMVPTTIDASALDISTYYPVTIVLPTKNTRIEVEVSLDSGTKPSWSTHNSGFTTRKVWESNGSGWGTTSIERNIFVSVYSFASEDPVRGIGQLINSSTEYVYVRGGGKYFFKVSIGGGTPTLQKATYTIQNQSVAPTKTAPALITPCINTPHKNVTLWGQNFNGNNNVSGTLSGVANIQFSANNTYDIGSNSNAIRYIYTHWIGAKSGQKLELGANNSGYGKGLCIDTNLNVGIGTNSPSYKLQVNGDIYSSGYIRASSGFIKGSSSDSYVLLGGGGHKTISSLSVNYANSAGNASTLGGTSLGGLFTAFGNNGHNITATIGGVTKQFLVNWAADSDKLDGKHASDFASAGHNHDGRYVKIWGNIEANFNFPDNEDHSGVYMCHTTKTQSNKPETYGLLTDFSTVNGHLQFFGASSNKIYARTYWWTGQTNFKYTDWHTLLHTGNSSVSGHTITINGTSTTWSDTWRPIGTGASDAAAGNHSHKIKINGNEKTIAATGVTDLGNYLTTHQSLSGYVNTISTIGGGNAVTSISKAGNAITVNKGTTFLTSHQSLANYYTKGQVDTKLGKYLPLAGGTMNAGAQIQRTANGGMWYQGRSIALLRETSANGYHALWSLKTTDGSWDFGEYNSSGWNNIPVLSYVLDSNFDKGSNTTTYQIKFPLASGTVALTSNILNPTNYYWANNKITSTSKIDAEVRVKNLGAGCSTTIENTIMATNWVRAMGNTGIYFQDHGGGLYMSDNTWIRTWAGKALQVDNTIRSTDFNTTHYANNVWTITSAAKLENSTTLVYGTSTSSQSINTYLRGTNVTLQVKKGTSISYNALQLTSDRIYCNNYCDMKYSVEVRGDHFTVWNDSYLAQIIGSKVGIGTKNPQYTLDVGDKMRAGGYIHSGHNSNDAMLLAGGGWKKLGTLVEYPSDESYIYRKTTTEYDLRFVKLVNFNNLIYVDGWISADANGKSFTLGAKFKPYLYRNDHSIPTIVQMGWDDVVTIDGDGNVGFHIEGGRKKRIGFFYTGRA